MSSPPNVVWQKNLLESRLREEERKRRRRYYSNITERDNISKEFRMALAALTTAEDLEALEEQLFQVKY